MKAIIDLVTHSAYKAFGWNGRPQAKPTGMALVPLGAKTRAARVGPARRQSMARVRLTALFTS